MKLFTKTVDKKFLFIYLFYLTVYVYIKQTGDFMYSQGYKNSLNVITKGNGTNLNEKKILQILPNKKKEVKLVNE